MQVLNDIGYHATLHRVRSTKEYDQLASRNQLQVTHESWGSDFPLASGFFVPLLTCRAGGYVGAYCNRSLDQAAAQATAWEAYDPGRAVRAWTAIDRTVTDDAPIVPFNNIDTWTYVSPRVGNYQSSPYWGPLLSQLWVN